MTPDEQDRLWEVMRDDIKELRTDVKAIRNKTDRLEAIAALLGALAGLVVAVFNGLFHRGGN